MDAFSSSAYLNGRFLPLAEVCISPLDRGFLFGDGVYEVIAVYNGQLFKLAEHVQRLLSNLSAIRLNAGLEADEWEALLQELVERNRGGDLSVYLQVTRGAPAVRDHGFPPVLTSPTVFAMVNSFKPQLATVYREGITAITQTDIRWGACDIKSIALLANIMARQQALDQGAAEAILVRDDYLTEGAASNVFVAHDGVIATPPKSQYILPGITRDLILELAKANGIPCREEALPAAVLETAAEVWLSSSTKEILPVTRVDGRPIGTGVPGTLWRRMMDLYQAHKVEVCPP